VEHRATPGESPLCAVRQCGRLLNAQTDEVILYFNVGLKPHQMVKDEMARFMAEVAPHFTNPREAA